MAILTVAVITGSVYCLPSFNEVRTVDRILGKATDTWGAKQSVESVDDVFISAGLENLEITIATNKEVYWFGEPIEIILKVANAGEENVSIEGYPLYDFLITTKWGRCIYRYSEGVAIQIIMNVTIPAGETVFRNFTWNQKGRLFPRMPLHRVRPGNYYVIGWFGNEKMPIFVDKNRKDIARITIIPLPYFLKPS